MTTHKLFPTSSSVHGAVSSNLKPALTIESGDTVEMQVVDVAYRMQSPVDTTTALPRILPDDKDLMNGPGCVGPIAVSGAEPGMTLSVRIDSIKTGPGGYTRYGAGMPMFGLADAFGVQDEQAGIVVWSLNNETGVATAGNGWTVPMNPFPGTIGVAPPSPEIVPGWAPRPTGGNMDCASLTAGSVIHFPVEAKGALLSIGDGHAAQGHGEVAGMAIECPYEQLVITVALNNPFTSRFNVQNNFRHTWAETPAGLVAFGFDEDLNRAAESAVSHLLDILTTQCSYSRGELLALASVAGDLHITQMVNGTKGAHIILNWEAVDMLLRGS